ncbi:MAG: NAD(P)H-dependent oxidoreductase, partial [Daejeonella sp.]
MENEIHLVGISGSLRKGSLNTMLLKEAAKLLPEGVNLEIVSFEDLPVYNGDLDIPEKPKRPASVQIFRNSLAKADGLVIVSPEYNYSIPGGLKNA